MATDVPPFFYPGSGWRLGRHLGPGRDFTLLFWGDSLLAREHHTSPGSLDPTSLPPMMHTRRMDWGVWQAIDYPKPAYRRLDHPGAFKRTGNWTISELDGAWDDTPYRPAWTAWSSDTDSSCTFTVQGRTWLLYRTDATGGTMALSVARGAGQVQAQDAATGHWREAHGYSVSQRQGTGPRVGNTSYPVRLALRLAPGASAMAVTVGNSGAPGTRLMLWGMEEGRSGVGYLRVENAARGSHTLEMLLPTMGNTVSDVPAQAIVLELPLLNMIHQRPDPEDGVRWVWDMVWGDRPGAENNWALRKAQPYGFLPDLLLMIPHHTSVHLREDDSFVPYGETDPPTYFGAIRDLLQRRGDVPWLDMAQGMFAAVDGDPAFLTRHAALSGSSQDGRTYTNDGLHQNDRGTAVYWRYLLPALAHLGVPLRSSA